MLQSWYCESPRNQATLFSRSFQTSFCGFMKGFQSMKTITKCLSFFKAILFPSVLICWKTFPLGNVVTYLYCNALFMFSIQDFFCMDTNHCQVLSTEGVSHTNNWGLSYKCGIRNTWLIKVRTKTKREILHTEQFSLKKYWLPWRHR